MRVFRTPHSFMCCRSLRSSHRFCSGGLHCGGTRTVHAQWVDEGEGEGSYLLRLVLGDVMQGAVRVQAHPHHPHRELGRPLVGL